MEEPKPIGMRKPSETTRPPSWVILDSFIHRSSGDAEARGDGTASETSYTCIGRLIRASLRLATGADLPAVSRLHLHWPGRLELRGLREPRVIAAHGHAILFKAIVPFDDPMSCTADTHRFPVDFFVYSAFSSPPALHRLPACFVGGDADFYFKPYRRRQQRAVFEEEMGILCHGGDSEFTVVEFTNFGRDGELCLLHHRGSAKKDIEPEEWMIKKVTFPQGPSAHHWVTDAVVPVDERFLCWVDNYQGVLVLDVVLAANDDESSSPGPVQLRYIPLPEEALQSDRLDPDGECPDSARCVCATAAGTIKLVCIERVSSDLTVRRKESSDFTVRSWTLHDINQGRWHEGEDMKAAEFWRLHSGEMSLPWVVKPEYPLVSLVDPNAVCFLLKEDHYTYWIIEVDMRNKVLKSFARYRNEEEEEGCAGKRVRRNVFDGHSFIPSEISAYLS
uniref:DUF1618 domain-containing protein n=1 Tax=Setaria viridis TaxID=4556 RepID=A0A4U6TLL7_SETVI|nr:hypothetical protein SEVIR_8G257800v2 [Setaria viridis]